VLVRIDPRLASFSGLRTFRYFGVRRRPHHRAEDGSLPPRYRGNSSGVHQGRVAAQAAAFAA